MPTQVVVRGPAAEVGEQPAGVRLGAPRGARGEDPSLVQLHQLAPHGGGPGQAALRARPTRRLCQGDLRLYSTGTVRTYPRRYRLVQIGVAGLDSVYPGFWHSVPTYPIRIGVRCRTVRYRTYRRYVTVPLCRSGTK